MLVDKINRMFPEPITLTSDDRFDIAELFQRSEMNAALKEGRGRRSRRFWEAHWCWHSTVSARRYHTQENATC